MNEAIFGKDDFFEVEILQDGSAEFEAEAECTCTGGTGPTCSCSNSNIG